MKNSTQLSHLHDFDFSRLLRPSREDDITEWFSDNDTYLSDILYSDNLAHLEKGR